MAYIPDKVTETGEGVFKDHNSLRAVLIPDGVTEIGEKAFYNCTGLSSIHIPASVEKIGTWAFRGCGDLTICSPEGFYAVHYADECGIEYEIIND